MTSVVTSPTSSTHTRSGDAVKAKFSGVLQPSDAETMGCVTSL